MVGAVPDVLARIVDHKKAELAAASWDVTELVRLAEEKKTEKRDFRKALDRGAPAVIAEIKKASPSKGLLTASFDPASIARSYEAGGASAMSVLTDSRFFQGSFADLEAARGAAALPVLRKDFTIDERHVIEAAARGADAILLIAAILNVAQMRTFREVAAGFGMAALVEVHDNEELDRALASGAEIVGVNNRNLHTFEVTLETSVQLAKRIPAGIPKVSESGIHSAADLQLLHAAGFQAFLVGEHLMKAADPAVALRALLS